MSRPSKGTVLMRGLLFTLVAVAALMLVPAADAAPEGRVVVAVASSSTTFDAHVFSDQPTYNVILNVFDTLVERGPDMQLRPLLAESYRLVDDRTWQFKLRKGIQFTNGEPFNAQVVKWNVERMLDPATKSKNVGRVSAIERVDVVDDLTVNIRTKAPYPILDAQLARVVHMMPPRYVQEKGATHIATNPIGTGPYRVVRWVKDDEIVLEANERYWRGAPRIKTIVIKPIPEITARVYALTNGEVDLAGGIAPHLVPGIEANGKAQVRKVPSLEVMYCGLYGAVGPTANKKVRQAINYGVNVDTIIKSVMEGDGERRAGILAKEAFGFDGSVKPYPYDPERARQLLREGELSARLRLRHQRSGRPLPERQDDRRGDRRRSQEDRHSGLGQASRVGELRHRHHRPEALPDAAARLGPSHVGRRRSLLDQPAQQVAVLPLPGRAPRSPRRGGPFDARQGQAPADLPRDRPVPSRKEATNRRQSVNIYGVSKRLVWTPRPDEYLKLYDAALK